MVPPEDGGESVTTGNRVLREVVALVRGRSTRALDGRRGIGLSPGRCPVLQRIAGVPGPQPAVVYQKTMYSAAAPAITPPAHNRAPGAGVRSTAAPERGSVRSSASGRALVTVPMNAQITRKVIAM